MTNDEMGLDEVVVTWVVLGVPIILTILASLLFNPNTFTDRILTCLCLLPIALTLYWLEMKLICLLVGDKYESL